MNRNQGIVVVVVLVLLTVGIGGLVTGASTVGSETNQDVSDGSETLTERQSTVQNPPEAVNNSKPQAQELLKKASERGYQNVEVYIQKDGSIVVRYDTQSEGNTQLKNEMQQLALMFAEIDGNPASLTVVTNGIQAIVPEPSVVAYRNDNLDEEAFKETIAYRNNGDDQTETDQDGN